MSAKTTASFGILGALIAAGIAAAILYFLMTQGVIKNPISRAPRVKLQTQYQNPFDKNTQYVNPFSSYQNPFDNLK